MKTPFDHRRLHLPRRPSVEQLEARRLLAADIVINEIMYHQAGNNVLQEFIELFNAGDQLEDVSGWKFDTGVDFELPSVSIPAGGYLVVAADLTEFAKLYPNITNVVGGWSGRLANRGEAITLVDDEDAIVDRVRYGDEGDWASARFLDEADNGQRGWKWRAEHDGDGKSLELQNAILPNELGHNWGSSIANNGTPGQENSSQSNDVPPIVSDFAHTPIIPTSNDVVSITAKVHDEFKETVNTTLSYRVDGETAYTVVPMTVKETSGDSSTLVATIPALADKTIVEFFLTATDNTGHARRVPNYESDDKTRTANRLYQVLDDAPSVDSWNPTADLHAAEPVTHLVITAAERNALRDIGDGPVIEAASNAQMNATFIRTDGNSQDVRYNVGIRNRGGSSRVGPPNNYRVNFRHDESFRGQSQLNFNSRFTYAQIMGSAIYRLAGMAAAEGRPGQVRVNGLDLSESGGPNMYGSYVEMEVVTGSFADKYFSTDRRGNLYRAIEAGTATGDLRFEGNDPEAYQDTYSKRTNEEEDDWTDLIDLVDVLNNTSEEEFVDEVNRVLNVDQWLRYIALDSLLGNLETGLNNGRGDNFWLYRGVEDSRFQMIPHDLDTILGVGAQAEPNRPIFSYAETPGLRRLLTHEEFVPRYYRAFVDLIEEVYNPDTINPLIDQLIGHVDADRRAAMKQYVVDRIAGVQAQLPQEFRITSKLPIVNGFHRTALPRIDLLGIANALETKSVRVNGELIDWSPFTREWSALTTGEGTTQSLVSAGAIWKYSDDGSNLREVWRSIDFNDSSWKSGQAPLGYGNGDEATRVDFGSVPANKHVTTYFRHDFEVNNAAEVLDLTMRLERDDGAIVYLNNQEVARTNMPDGIVDFQTVASSWISGGPENQQLTFSIDPNTLRDGMNTLAVEVHQVNSFDDDLRLDLAMEATVGIQTGGVELKPGVNRISVEAFADPHGVGEIVDQGTIDVWYDGATVVDQATCESLEQSNRSPHIISGGALTTDTILAPCGPAYRVTGEVTIPEGVTLTMLPGTTVFFEVDAGFVVHGQLIANGSKYEPIRFTRIPGSDGSWSGIHFVNSTSENRISHAILEYATTADGMIGLVSSTLEIEDTTFDNSDLFRIVTVNSSLAVRNSHFTDIFLPGTPPASDNGSEHIKGSGILDGGKLVLEGNYFGTTSGHNDSVDFDGAELPGPIPIIRDNTFAGSGDDALDLESDALIEGNHFSNIIKDQFNTSTGDANAISAGAGRTYFVFRNTFHNVDHAVQVKDNAFLHFEHNTVDTAHISPIYFDLDDRSPGLGAKVSSSIFSNTPTTFGSADQAQILNITNSIVTIDTVETGEGNFLADPRFADAQNGDFRLQPGSLAKRRAISGMDLGALVSAGAWIDGQPPATTGRTSFSFAIGGPGITHYQYRVRTQAGVGDWSSTLEVEQPVRLENLPDGTYELEVVGRDVAGDWQSRAAPAQIRPWKIESSKTHLYLSEILASNDSVTLSGGSPDAIELHNDSDQAIDLSGFSISDDPMQRRKFVFADGLSILPGGYQTLLATDEPGNGIRLGFRLSREGEQVYLFDRIGDELDSVKFGIQVTDLPISRVGYEREWKLSEPTFGSENRVVAVGKVNSLRLNEWLAANETRFTSDFVEIYNTDSVPVDLSGISITDAPLSPQLRGQIAPLSFIDGQSFETFDLNSDRRNKANELDFGLSKDGELIAILDANRKPIDQVVMLSQTNDVSQGRSPDGTSAFAYLDLATPGNPNPVTKTVVSTLLDFDAAWAFDQSGVDFDSSWRAESFDDGSWKSGHGPFGVANDPLPVPINTPLDPSVVTTYLRSTFEVDPALLANKAALENERVFFELSTLLDDGAIIYVNEAEVLRLGVPDGEVNSQTRANRGVSTANIEGPFLVPASVIRPGKNTIAVEVHQLQTASLRSDVVFAAKLTATQSSTDPQTEQAVAILDGLRVSELMYHPNGNNDAEFIELTNVSSQEFNLSGVTIAGDVDANISNVRVQPGEYVLLTPDVDVFRETYGDAPRVAGTYSGSLANSGAEIIVTLPPPFDSSFDGAVLRFTYSDSWHPASDGDGYSIEVVNPNAPIRTLSSGSSWRQSASMGGSPGAPENSETINGDFDEDGKIDSKDADILSATIVAQSVDKLFDLNEDNQVNSADQSFMIEDILLSRSGDTNLDGKVNFADFLVLSANFGKKTSKWSEGDFDANGKVDFADFLALSANFGFDRDRR